MKGGWKDIVINIEEMDMKLAASKFLTGEIAKRVRVWPGLAFGMESGKEGIEKNGQERTRQGEKVNRNGHERNWEGNINKGVE